MASLSLPRLRELLQRDAEAKSAQAEREARHEAACRPLRESICEFWRRHGVLEDPATERNDKGSEDDQGPSPPPAPPPRLYQRPIPDSLFQSPLSEPTTALVRYNRLPRPVQAQLKHLELAPDAPDVVEVPRSLLEPGDWSGDSSSLEVDGAAGGTTSQADAAASRHHRRPLQGNLTSKLSEYTRGMSGQARPFRPGGLGPSQAAGAAAGPVAPHDQEMRDAAAIARSNRVLQIGTRAAWEEGGLLLTAPPGAAVNFKVGLSWKDVYGTDENDDDDEQHFGGDNDVVEGDDEDEEVGGAAQSQLASDDARSSGARRPSAPLFSTAFFDDDSLFGSSSSSGDDDDDDDDDDGSDAGDATQARRAPTSDKTEDGTPAEDVANANLVKAIAQLEISTDPEEVDNLLLDLTLTDPSSRRRQAADRTTTAAAAAAATRLLGDPMGLAESRARDQADAHRKSWAHTGLLPIRDWDAAVPNPALVYPFQLDDFQQQAIARLERSESVFVAAHTSAGKTVVAEYAVALAKQRATRCVYTSPIKALSNQKFRDFSLKFGADSIGLVTGDLQVNVDHSTCLIMTTEILRSMLYRGADLIRDIEYVIFDEVHYVNDTERGVVWEEVIIMLPSYVNLIFLSATTPNTIEFSDWIGRTKRKPVYVVRTDYRPVPLSHHLWAGNKLHQVMEGKGGFQELGYKEAADSLIPQSVKDAMKKGGPKAKPSVRPATGSKQLAWQAQGSKANWMSLVRFLEREFLTPTVVFSFSKKKCVEIANMLRSLDLNNAKERGAVQGFALQTVARLSPGDAALPQVVMVCEMVARGIGVHHGGLLPILKEMVEILFSRNLIKVLFATETFAMGVNMPARSVVFNSIRKHDGNQFRVLEPGEYTQMAGRAGRRGLDKVGTVILCCFGEEPLPQHILKQMLTGQSTRLQSQFRLTYNMILNLLRVEDMSVESMISRSFSEFATQRALTSNEYPQLLARGTRTLAKLDDKFDSDASKRIGAEDLEAYYNTSRSLASCNDEILRYVEQTEAASFSDILPAGRIVLVTASRKLGCVRAPSVVMQLDFGNSMPTGKAKQEDASFICLILLPPGYVPPNVSEPVDKGAVGYVGISLQRHYTIQNVGIQDILLVSSLKRKVDPKAILVDSRTRQTHGMFNGGLSQRDDPFAGMKAHGRKSLKDSASDSPMSSSTDQKIDHIVQSLLDAESVELQGEGLELLDLRAYLKRGSDVMHYRKRCDVLDDLVIQLRSCASHRHPNIEKFYLHLERKELLREKIDTLQHLLSNESLQLFPDYLQRKSVLRRLGYIDANETVCVKGRVACEVNTCEELIATEMVFEGILNDLQPEEIAAALSALVFQGKTSDEEFDVELPDSLVTCCNQMKTVARNLGQLQKEQGLAIDPADYCEATLSFGLVHVVYEWAMGVPFKSICDLTDVEEGSIVRCITRLDELCREVRNCARVVGNPTLYRKMEAASVAIKRDIVFASSLYVS